MNLFQIFSRHCGNCDHSTPLRSKSHKTSANDAPKHIEDEILLISGLIFQENFCFLISLVPAMKINEKLYKNIEQLLKLYQVLSSEITKSDLLIKNPRSNGSSAVFVLYC